MKLFFLLILLSFSLSGCYSNYFVKENSVSDETKHVSSNTSDNESAASYLNIAKDLFVAGQYKQAYQIASNLSEQNNIEAQYLLGYMTYYGYGIPVDTTQGTKLITISADRGYRPAIEALVLIKHGLTPDNNCSSVNLQSDETEVANNKIRKEIKSVEDDIKSPKLKEGEVLITPKRERTNNKDVLDYVQSSKTWDRYTIQLMITKSKTYAQSYVKDFKKQNPDLSEYIISYQSKDEPHSYGVGFSTFKKNDDAIIVLENIKNRLNSPSLWIRRLDKFEPLNID
ncbi:MAG: hypothetical protein OQL19_12630 [Gammaproteobacteria bacterium]|nr:hypothetical protein [Gammaproteobacteria bacterium]